MLKSTILDSLGQKYLTDKSGASEKTHDYLRKYEFFLKPLRDKSFTFLELGIYKGGSLKTWEEYFSQAKIVGVDIEKETLIHKSARSEVIIGDLSATEFLQSLTTLKPYVIMDDASHWWPDQLKTLFILFPSLLSGGIYIIEDIHTSFEPLAPHFSCGFAIPTFKVLLKIAEYMTANERPAPIFRDKMLMPFEKDSNFHEEIRYIADRTDALTFIERACILIKK